jgi:hypothetical protein
LASRNLYGFGAVPEGVDGELGVGDVPGAVEEGAEGVDGVAGFVFGVGRTGSCTPGLSSAGLPLLSM